MSIKHQEYQFVAWSKNVSLETYDVKHIADTLRSSSTLKLRVADVGGGIGIVAAALADDLPQSEVEVFENSELALRDFVQHPRTQLVFGDFLDASDCEGTYDAVIFRTVLHHFVGRTERETLALQLKAVAKARQMLKPGGYVFVTENFYEPFLLSDISGRLIFELTALKATAKLFRRLGANTAGEGVRFRSFNGWKRIFSAYGFDVAPEVLREDRAMPWWQRLAFLCRRRYQALLTLRAE